MKQKPKELYEDTDKLREFLTDKLKGRKFRLDCGHCWTVGHNRGNNVMIYNGAKPRIICSLCSY